MRPMLRQVGAYLDGEYKRNMTSGLDPNGKPLAPVAGWTRVAGRGAGASRKGSNPTPLMNTGVMRAALGVLSVTKTLLEFGWRGAQLDKARRMIKGTRGTMRVLKKGVKGKYSGIKKAKKDDHEFVRINTAVGWRTKQVRDSSIQIKPRKRNFFFLSKKQGKRAIEIADEWASKQVNAA